jgi:hypothetical protein
MQRQGGGIAIQGVPIVKLPARMRTMPAGVGGFVVGGVPRTRQNIGTLLESTGTLTRIAQLVSVVTASSLGGEFVHGPSQCLQKARRAGMLIAAVVANPETSPTS